MGFGLDQLCLVVNHLKSNTNCYTILGNTLVIMLLQTETIELLIHGIKNKRRSWLLKSTSPPKERKQVILKIKKSQSFSEKSYKGQKRYRNCFHFQNKSSTEWLLGFIRATVYF